MLTQIDDVEGYTQFIHRLMAQMAVVVLGMTEEQQARFFQMITDNADIMTTLFPGSELFQHAAGSNDAPVDSQILQAYQAWKISRGG